VMVFPLAPTAIVTGDCGVEEGSAVDVPLVWEEESVIELDMVSVVEAEVGGLVLETAAWDGCLVEPNAEAEAIVLSAKILLVSEASQFGS
jgi:hypothetical protein